MGRRVRYRCFYPWGARYLFPIPSYNGNGSPDVSGLQAFHAHEATHNGLETELLQHADDFCSHRFAFLNIPPVNLGNPVDWSFAPESDRLWQYNLHYGEWAVTLMQAYLVSNETRFKDSLIDLLNDWIDHNPVGKGPGWEPYPISRRLVAWSRVGLALAEDPSWQDFMKMRLVPSLRQQAKFLARISSMIWPTTIWWRTTRHWRG